MATGIAQEHQKDFPSTCLATKLSWAANRQTMREEDMAYNLLGLLGVHMPLLYGKGKQACIQLQHELFHIPSDESTFAWRRQHGMSHGTNTLQAAIVLTPLHLILALPMVYWRRRLSFLRRLSRWSPFMKVIRTAKDIP